MIGILDVDLGNLRSVANACDASGLDWRYVRTPAELDDPTHLILPGVGSFRTAMGRLEERGLVAPLRAFAASGRPFLGICLGMQLLAATGDEGGAGPGLGLIPGHVRRFDPERVAAIPHVGWNGVAFSDAWRKHPVARKVKSGVDFYFVHSFHLQAADAADVYGTSDSGEPFAAIVGRGNVLGFQFHPEKSQVNGLRLIENFADWDGSC